MNKLPKKKKPPIIASWLLERIFPPGEFDTAKEDFEEVYFHNVEHHGRFKAGIWYWIHLLSSIVPSGKNNMKVGAAMFKNYLKIALRNIVKQKVYSAINILGLSIGLTCTVLIYLYVADELSFDNFHAKKENIYRTFTYYNNPDGSVKRTVAGVILPMGPAMEEFFPEVEHSVRVYDRDVVVKKGNDLYDEVVLTTDKSFFEMFSFPLISGSRASVLAELNGLVLSEEYAKKFFRDQNPLGKTLSLSIGQRTNDFVVTGVARQAPPNSSITFTMLINIESLRLFGEERRLKNWNLFGYQHYVALRDAGSYDKVRERFPSFAAQHYTGIAEQMRNKGEWEGDNLPYSFGLQKLSDEHLDPLVSGTKNYDNAFILSGIAFIVLFIACVNFMNLSVGRSSIRSVEIGVRKVMGAGKKQLIRQFWGESIVMVFFAMIAGLFLSYFVTPVFNELSGKSLTVADFFVPENVFVLLLIMLLVAIASGSYPALIMSGYKPVEILKGKLKMGSKNVFTKSLVVVQFGLSIFLVISTVIMGEQIELMTTKDLGYEKEGLIVLRSQVRGGAVSEDILNRYREKLQQYPAIKSVSGASGSFGRGYFTFTFDKGVRDIESYQTRVEYDYFKTLGVNFVKGRNFSREIVSDTAGVVVNEKLVEKLGIKDPVGKPLEGFYMPLNILGVVKDFNIGSLKDEITPALYHIQSWTLSYFMIRVSRDNIGETLNILRKSWQELETGKPFLYSFLDDDLRSQYEEEKRWGAIVRYSSFFSILIACMGVFGLTSMAIQRRIREIGIRKVLGSRASQIVRIVTNEFIVLISLANIIAWPVAYYTMDKFLQGYFYKVPLAPAYFLVAGLLSVTIAFLTILFLALKAAYANPVIALKYE